MSTPPSDRMTDEGLLVFEAPTAEEALAQVTEELGPGASIVDASKSLQGGVGGFFAKEMVRLRVQPPTGPATAAPSADPAPTTARTPERGPRRTAVEALLDQLAADEGPAPADEHESFGDYLRRHLGDEAATPASSDAGPAATAPRTPATPPWPRLDAPAVERDAPTGRVLGPDAYRTAAPVPFPGAAPTTAVSTTAADAGSWAASLPVASAAPIGPAVDPAPAGAPARRTGTVAEGAPLWSQTTLDRIGLPESLVAACADLDPADDAAWIATIAAGVAPACRPLPSGAAVYAGPLADHIAAALDLPTVTPPDAIGTSGSVAATVTGSARDQGWLSWARHGRHVHLVAGGSGWRPLLFGDPAAISWVGADALPTALAFALRLGLVLGYEVSAAGEPRARRANAVDVALSVRDLVPRR